MLFNPTPNFMIKKNVLHLALLLVLLISCTDDDGSFNREAHKEDLLRRFYEYDFTIVKELPDPNAFLTSGKTQYVPPGGMIVDSREIIVASGNTEQYATVPSGYIVTGIGAQIQSSSNNYYSLLLEYRYLYADGTLGPRFRVYSGNILDPSLLEAWCQVPDGALAWSVAVRGKYDVQKLKVGYRYLNTSTLRLEGSTQYSIDGLDTGLQENIEYTPTDPNYGLDLDRSVILGLGLTSTNGGTTVMRVDVGTLQ
jgi:hypothetical protein